MSTWMGRGLDQGTWVGKDRHIKGEEDPGDGVCVWGEGGRDEASLIS